MRSQRKTAISYLLIGLAALLNRVFDLGHFLNSDEINFWIERSYTFLQALQSGDYAATAISTHPGVTTMWLGSAGIVLRRTLFEYGVLTEETFPLILSLMRLPVVLVHVAGLLVGYLLLRQLFSPAVAFLAALFWATDPFLIAFERILHVDGLTGTFATLSLLAACVSWNRRGHTLWLIVSAVCAALAVLSKSPGIATVPVVGGLALATSLSEAYRQQRNEESAPTLRWMWRGIVAALPPLLAWGSVFTLTVVVVWPAVWADPMRVYHLLRVGVEVEGGSHHVIANYFLDRLNPAPGPLYYPVVLAIRTTPWTLAGLLLLPLALLRLSRHKAQNTERTHSPFPIPHSPFPTLAVLAGFVVLFVAAMSFFPKKLDRYLVPTFHAVDVLAAFGLVWAFAQWRAGVVRQASTLAYWLIVSAALVNAAWWHPYGVAYFNQALGGIQMGIRTILIGEGEGLGEAAAWLNEQPDITGVTTTSTMVHTLQAFMRHGAQIVSEQGKHLDSATGYVVVYIRHMQRWGNDPPPPYDQFYQRVEPVHTVRVHGVDYARIYEVPPPITHTLETDFGSAIQLRGYDVTTSTLRSTGRISLTVQWRARAPIPNDYHMFVHVLNTAGERITQIDVPPAGPHRPTPTWEPRRHITWVHPIPLPADLPPGTYWLVPGLYDPDDFSRLPVQGAPEPPPGAPEVGAGALVLPVRVE